MKKKKRAAFVAAALILAACALICLRAGGAQTLERVAFSGARGVMRVEAEIGEDLRRVTGEQRYEAENETGQALDALVLRLYPNAVREDSFLVSGVTVDGREAVFSLDADDPTVLRVEADWQPGQTRVFAWRFALTIPLGEGAVGRADGEALCAGALPVPALLEDGVWRTDAYDALAGTLGAAKFDYELTLAVPDGVRAAFGGAPVARVRADGKTVWTAQGEGAADIPFALAASGAVRTGSASGVLVTALAPSALQASALLKQAKKALGALEELGLPYPGRALCVCRAQTGYEDGLAASGLIAVPQEADAEQSLRRITRLIARQIFGIDAQNDPWNDPWLSVSLASSVEMLAYRHRAGEGAYERRFLDEIEIATRLTRPHGVTVGAAADRFGGDAEMTQVLRDQGAAMLLGIEQAVGEERYLRALRLYSARAGDGLADRALLEEALFEATGSRWDGYLEDELSW